MIEGLIIKALKIMETKGFIIGFFSGLLKVMQNIRSGTFKWMIAITDMVAAIIAGYSVYQWASDSEVLDEWQVVFLTIVIALNTFIVVRLFTDPVMFRRMIKSWFKVDIGNEK